MIPPVIIRIPIPIGPCWGLPLWLKPLFFCLSGVLTFCIKSVNSPFYVLLKTSAHPCTESSIFVAPISPTEVLNTGSSEEINRLITSRQVDLNVGLPFHLQVRFVKNMDLSRPVTFAVFTQTKRILSLAFYFFSSKLAAVPKTLAEQSAWLTFVWGMILWSFSVCACTWSNVWVCLFTIISSEQL